MLSRINSDGSGTEVTVSTPASGLPGMGAIVIVEPVPIVNLPRLIESTVRLVTAVPFLLSEQVKNLRDLAQKKNINKKIRARLSETRP